MDVLNEVENMSQASHGSSLDEQQLQQIETSSKPATTQRSTIYGIKKFTDWVQKRAKTCDFQTITAEDLNELLRKYYAEVKSAKPGVSLTPSTLTCLRAAIHRHITSAPLNRPLNIIKDREFTSANAMFTARCKLFFKQGNKKPQHKPTIGDADMTKLGQYLSAWRSNPSNLVEACWFFLCYSFGRRGREGWTAMTKNTFVIQTDSDGYEHVSMNTTEVTNKRTWITLTSVCMVSV